MSRSSATIRDVARVAGLSVASVSRVLNGHENVTPETREKVVAAMRALHYSPHAGARSLSTARNHALGVVLPGIYGEFFSELIRGMEGAAQARGYVLLLSSMHADPVLARQAMAAMRGRVDGLVVMAPQLDAEEREAVLPPSLPIVLLNSPEAGEHAALQVDNAGGIRAVVAHLLAGGRRAIVHLAGPEANVDAQERAQAYRMAMSELAPNLPQRMIHGDFREESGMAAMRTLLAEGLPIDAVVAGNDMMALGALQVLRDAGLAVPGQIAVTGFDDVPVARFVDLTTVRVDIAEMGAGAIDTLVALLDPAAPKAAPAVTLCETHLIERGTSRPAG